jgi:capsular exopolysaccharide synthesis family protein
MMEQNAMTWGTASQLREYLGILRRYSRSILAITVVVAVVAGIVSFVLAPKYVSESKVLVTPVSLLSNQPGQQIAPDMDTEREVAASLAVGQLAAESLNVSLTPNQIQQGLLKRIKVSSAANTQILTFSYTAGSPAVAQQGAAAFANAYLEFRRDQVVNNLTASQTSLQARIDSLAAQLKQVNTEIARTNDPNKIASLQGQSHTLVDELGFLEANRGSLVSTEQLSVGAVVEQATLPIHQATSRVRNLILAVLVGLSLGIGISFLRDRLDDRLRNRGEVEAAIHAPVLGVLPFAPTYAAFGRSIGAARTHGIVPDAFRALRTGLLFSAGRADAKTFLITSPLPEDGKTTTVANLGYSLALAGKRVILISADMRRPRLHKLFASTNDFGLTNVLAGERAPFDGLVVSPELLLLPSGPSPSNVIDLLDSERMKQLLATYRKNVDVVLIDSGPVIGGPDAMTLAPLVDAVLLVMNAKQTTRSAAQRARKQLELVNARVIGTVLYDPADEAHDNYYYYSDPYSAPNGEQPGNGHSRTAHLAGQAPAVPSSHPRDEIDLSPPPPAPTNEVDFSPPPSSPTNEVDFSPASPSHHRDEIDLSPPPPSHHRDEIDLSPPPPSPTNQVLFSHPAAPAGADQAGDHSLERD